MPAQHHEKKNSSCSDLIPYDGARCREKYGSENEVSLKYGFIHDVVYCTSLTIAD